MRSLSDMLKSVARPAGKMSKVEEIFRAWGIAVKPNDAQFELATKRIEICEACPFKADNPIKRCTVCGCALKGKIYSPVKGACPKGKWDEIDGKEVTV